MARKSLLLLVLAILTSAAANAAEPADAQAAKKKARRAGIEFFESKIRPVLAQHCYECHSARSKSVKGSLLVDSRDGLRKGGESGAAVVPGKPNDSLIIEALKHDGLEMPPKEKLPDQVIADFERWIAMGAPDPRGGKAQVTRREINLDEGRQFWAFQPPQRIPPAAVKHNDWPRSEIDRYLLATMEQAGLVPSPDADRGTWLRRITFDLTGLPPTVEELKAFLNDSSDRAYETVVDRLLASPRFGERWGRHWLDVARYAESTGKERDVPYPYAWRYRNYVIDAFNADKPFDRFITEQVAGDLLPADSVDERNELLTATGFLTIGPKSLNDKKAATYLMDVVDEQLDVTTRAVMAITVGCARCHDHKFDPIPTTDYYAFAGIFRSTDIYPGVKRGSRAPSADDLMSLEHPEVEQKKLAPEVQKQVDALLVDLKQARQVLKKEQAKTKKNKKKKNQDEDKAPSEAAQKVAGITDQLTELGWTPPPSPVPVMAAQDSSKPANCQVCIRGDVEDLGPEVPRGFLSVIKREDDPQIPASTSGRLQLAQWLTSKQNPLTARVLANRVWQHLFGVGIVGTVDNFGALGEKPSHPELLDYLALRCMEDGWSIKRLIRSIVLTRAYRQSADHNAANYAIDPENRLLWRANRRRLDAEAIRDAILACSGSLNLSRPDSSPLAGMKGEVGRGLDLSPLEKGEHRRSVYLPILRTVVPDFLAAFDMADPSLPVGQREVTTIATQALLMMNSPFVLEQSQAFAKRLLDQEMDESARVDLAFQLALGHLPTDSQRTTALNFLKDFDQRDNNPKQLDSSRLNTWTSFCQSLYCAAEFRYEY